MILFNLHATSRTKLVIKMIAKTIEQLISSFIMKLCPDSDIFHAFDIEQYYRNFFM